MSFDDLLGERDEPEPILLRRGPGRPRKHAIDSTRGERDRARRAEVEKEATAIPLQAGSSVTVNWLAMMFHRSRRDIISALQGCPPVGNTRNGGALYDLKEAAPYLVVSKRDQKAFLKTITAKDLPNELRETFWNAKIKEMKARTMAGELWPTTAVLEVLGETFKTLKKTTQLWADTIDESLGLTVPQRELLTVLVDKLMGELHTALVEQARNSSTVSFAEDLDNEIDPS